MTVLSFVRFRSAALLAALFSVCACGTTTHHLVSEPVEIHKLFVLTQLGTDDNNSFATSFNSSFTNALQSCNIEVQTENVTVKDRSLSLDTDPFVGVNKDLHDFKPDYLIRLTQQNSTEVSRALNGVGITIFLMKLSGTEGAAWNGRFRADSRLDAAAGTALAQSIMNKMQEDDVIRNCHIGNSK